MSKELWRVGEDYQGSSIDPASCGDDPIAEVRAWLTAAVGGGIATPNAMTLATVDGRGRPAARIVLLKEIDDRGFVFFTNYDSRKGHELATHPHAALVMFWEPMHRQVRIEGAVEKVAASDSDAYFASRPRGSQLGAIASPQSQVIAGRKVLEDRVAAVSAQHGESPLPRPAFWGGYRVVPDAIELWQGQPSRLHDRVQYRKVNGVWTKERLAP